MSDAIRCGQCRWWREIEPAYKVRQGFCELGPAQYMSGDPLEFLSWQQPVMVHDTGCSRGKPKTEASNLTVSDGDPVAMVDGLPVFRAKLTEEET